MDFSFTAVGCALAHYAERGRTPTTIYVNPGDYWRAYQRANGDVTWLPLAIVEEVEKQSGAKLNVVMRADYADDAWSVGFADNEGVGSPGACG